MSPMNATSAVAVSSPIPDRLETLNRRRLLGQRLELALSQLDAVAERFDLVARRGEDQS